MLEDKFAVQPEILYSTHGVKYDSGNLQLDYITIPVMLKYYATNEFSFELGSQIGFLTLASSACEDVKDFIKSTDFGFNIGVGYDITTNIILGARYNFGVTRIQKDLFPGESESRN